MQFQNSLLAIAGLLTVNCLASPAAPKPTQAPVASNWVNYTTVPGFFLQDDAETNPTGFDYVSIPRRTCILIFRALLIYTSSLD